MAAHQLNMRNLQILILLSCTAVLAKSQICYEKKTEMMPIKRNGNIEMVPVNRRVRSCCEGYIIDKNKPSECVSLCSEGFVYESGSCLPRCDECENGTCMAPNECQCEDDYVKVKTGCAPKCEDECKNGYCARPGVCECNEGYVQSKDDSGGCVPICIDCENGFCLKPGECQCKPGFKWNISNMKCRPKCSIPCQHGHCTAPDTCSCDKGYRHSSLQPNICLPAKSGGNDANFEIEPTSQAAEVEGIFRYMGRKIHFTGHFDEVEDEL